MRFKSPAGPWSAERTRSGAPVVIAASVIFAMSQNQADIVSRKADCRLRGICDNRVNARDVAGGGDWRDLDVGLQCLSVRQLGADRRGIPRQDSDPDGSFEHAWGPVWSLSQTRCTASGAGSGSDGWCSAQWRVDCGEPRVALAARVMVFVKGARGRHL